MKQTFKIAISIAVLASATLACSLGNTSAPTPTPDAQATISAAIDATSTAQAAEATATPLAEEQTAEEQPTEEYVVMTEEELNEVIDQSVDEAIKAYDEANAYTTEAASDGELTSDEIDEIYYYYAYADELIALADEYIYLYYDLYAELIEETVYLLEAVEDDLAAMESAADEVTATIETAAETVQAGQEVRQETLDLITTNVQEAQQSAQDIGANWQNWDQAWLEERDNRIQSIQDIVPNFVPGSREEALNETVKFADTARNALSDFSLSATELFDIAQLGSNAVAGLQGQGSPALLNLADTIGSITNQLALGQTPHALDGLGRLEGSMRDIPDMPSRPEFSPPSPPSLPSRPGGGSRRP